MCITLGRSKCYIYIYIVSWGLSKIVYPTEWPWWVESSTKKNNCILKCRYFTCGRYTSLVAIGWPPYINEFTDLIFHTPSFLKHWKLQNWFNHCVKTCNLKPCPRYRLHISYKESTYKCYDVHLFDLVRLKMHNLPSPIPAQILTQMRIVAVRLFAKANRRHVMAARGVAAYLGETAVKKNPQGCESSTHKSFSKNYHCWMEAN